MKRGTPEHPKMRLLAKKLGVSLPQAIGTMELLWHWASRYAIQGNIGKWKNEIIAQAVYWDDDPDLLVNALCDSGWIDADPVHRYVIHDIKDHADNTWRQNLVDAGLTWWDGSSPRNEKPGRPNKKTPGKLQGNSRDIPDNLVS